jgi:hypothetical protein
MPVDGQRFPMFGVCGRAYISGMICKVHLSAFDIRSSTFIIEHMYMLMIHQGRFVGCKFLLFF